MTDSLDDLNRRLLAFARELAEIGYSLPVVLMHGAIGDNGSASAAFTPSTAFLMKKLSSMRY